MEINSAKRRSWAICSQITNVDRVRFLSQLGVASETEMLKIDVALRKALALPLDSTVDRMSTRVSQLEEDKSRLELELEIQKSMYDRVLGLLVEERTEKDIKNTSVPEPEVVVEEPEPIEVDTELLKQQMLTPNDDLPVESKAKKRNPQYETVAAMRLKERMDAAKQKMVGKKANINTATTEELMGAAGMGIGMARIIVKRRRDFGPYKDVSDLLDIKQLSDKMFTKYEPFLEV